MRTDAPAHGRPFGDARELPEAWIENRPPDRRLPRLELRELWAYRELAIAFALKTLRVRYQQMRFRVWPRPDDPTEIVERDRVAQPPVQWELRPAESE